MLNIVMKIKKPSAKGEADLEIKLAITWSIEIIKRRKDDKLRKKSKKEKECIKLQKRNENKRLVIFTLKVV